MVTYANADDVKRVLQMGFKFTETGTNPTKDEIEKSIEEAETIIDRATQHAWRSKSVSNEFYDFPKNRLSYRHHHVEGIPIMLRHREIKAIKTSVPDKIEIWNGSDYDDWASEKTEGRNKDFWLDHEQGILYIRHFHPFFIEKAIRMTYRYGGSAVPEDIRRATALNAAILFLESEDRGENLIENGDVTRVTYLDRINKWEKQINKIVQNRFEPSVIR